MKYQDANGSLYSKNCLFNVQRFDSDRYNGTCFMVVTTLDMFDLIFFFLLALIFLLILFLNIIFESFEKKRELRFGR